MKQHERPDIFTYHDHINFLRDWLEYLKKVKVVFSMRTLSQKSAIAVGYLPMVLSGKRELSEKAYFKILPHLNLNQQEQKFLTLLRLVGETADHETRIHTINQMAKLRRFQNSNTKDLRVFEYLTKWYYVAIRELILVKDFKMDPEWIQSRLNGRMSRAEIECAIAFLKEQNFITENSDGKWIHDKASLDCKEGIFKLSLGQFHRQMLEMAATSIEKTPRNKRYILGHTVAISQQDFEKIKQILDHSVEKMKLLDSNPSAKSDVYHIEMVAFPLTQTEGE